MRVMISLTAVLVLTVSIFSNPARKGTLDHVASAHQLEPAAFRAQTSTSTVIFRGLMILHPDQSHQYFDVRIVNGPEHDFRIQMRENSPNGVSIVTVPLPQLKRPAHEVWSLKFGTSAGESFSLYQNGAFNRNRDIGDEKDFRWLIDLEGKEFYDRRLVTNSDRDDIVLRISSGEFYTKKRTLPMMRRKGDGSFQYFGAAADQIATDISLGKGDLVLRSEKTGLEILRVTAKPETTYEIVIENIFVGDHHMASNLNHFRYYYGLLPEPKSEWYEFRAIKGEDVARVKSVLAHHVSRVPPLTDEAPCMLIGLGGGR
jgi:hypothetical protein